jgi:hypothetical protein
VVWAKTGFCSSVFPFGATWFGGNRAEMASGLVQLRFTIRVGRSGRAWFARGSYHLILFSLIGSSTAAAAAAVRSWRGRASSARHSSTPVRLSVDPLGTPPPLLPWIDPPPPPHLDRSVGMGQRFLQSSDGECWPVRREILVGR